MASVTTGSFRALASAPSSVQHGWHDVPEDPLINYSSPPELATLTIEYAFVHARLRMRAVDLLIEP
jgi:hypothetical protein